MTATATSPARTLSLSDVRRLVATGGYVHELFRDVGERTPVPGGALLMLMGGLAEQSGAYGAETRALLRFEQVEFLRPVRAGSTIQVEVTVGEPTDVDGRRTSTSEWVCLKDGDEVAARVRAVFLLTSRTTVSEA